MKVTLVSLDHELYCIGVRILSSCLRKAGHEVQIIFLIPPKHHNSGSKFKVAYPDEILHGMEALCADSGLIGISLMSNQFIQGIQITEFLKSRKLNAPIIWGGVQPTVEPEECLKYADLICIGEGEEGLVELVNRMSQDQSFLGTRNIWFKTPAGIVRNPLRPLIQDLDSLPFPEYRLKNHYIADGNRLEALTGKKFLEFQGERFRSTAKSFPYMLMTSRGCPSSCTYCCNSVYKELYPGQRLLRWRSDWSIIQELKMIQEEIASISYVYMVDDNFTARPADKLKAFCDLYKREIGIPFFAQVSPLTINEEKMEILFNGGCAHITMGIETASERVAGIYNRTGEHKVMGAAIALVEKYRSQMNPPPTYQFIIDNPYEKMEEMRDTLRLAMSFPRPWHNPIYSLMLFPGVSLHKRAMEDGVIVDRVNEIYTRNWRSQSKPFLQFWIRLYHANVSPVILRALLAPRVIHTLTTNIADTIWKLPIFRWLWDNPT